MTAQVDPDTRSRGGCRKILHLDLDSFYPSVEVVDNPALAGLPVIVGGLGPRGVVASASYEARQVRVHSALPMAIARRRCPDGVFLRPRFDRYRAFSRRVFAIYRGWSDLVEPLSLDEAYLDVSHRAEDGADIARRIQEAVAEETGLTVSAGVSYNKFLAKLASDLEKPNGLVEITQGRAERLLGPLPVRKLWGVGPATSERLQQSGLETIGDIADCDRERLRELVGSAAERLAAFARGEDERRVSPPGQPRTISAETTFDRNIRDWHGAAPHVRDFAERLADSLARHDLWARTVVLKVRYGDFQTVTRSSTPKIPVRSRDDILGVARSLALRVDRPPSDGIRLIGLGVHNLVDEPAEYGPACPASTQMDLF